MWWPKVLSCIIRAWNEDHKNNSPGDKLPFSFYCLLIISETGTASTVIDHVPFWNTISVLPIKADRKWFWKKWNFLVEKKKNRSERKYCYNLFSILMCSMLRVDMRCLWCQVCSYKVWLYRTGMILTGCITRWILKIELKSVTKISAVFSTAISIPLHYMQVWIPISYRETLLAR